MEHFSHFSRNLKINVPSMAIIPNITGICKRPLQAIISPKSVPVALTIKLLTVSVSPDVKAKKWLQVQTGVTFTGISMMVCLVKII